MKSIDLLGVRIDLVTVDLVHTQILEFVRQGRRALVFNVNVRALNLAHSKPWFRDFLNRADLVFCDGAGVMLAARILGQRIPERITYADWMVPLSRFACESGLRLYLLGGREGVALRAAKCLHTSIPGLEIVGIGHGFFDKSRGSIDTRAVVEAINRAAPDILVVGFGMPSQERWLMENWEGMKVRVGLTGGSVFDYVSGDLRRGPRWMTQHNLEWLARLVIEPRRLWRRYLLGLPQFFLRVMAARLIR